MFCCWQLSAVQLGVPHWYATPPPPQVVPDGQGPQVTVLPQPSGSVPHWALSCWQVLPVQVEPPHWLATPPPPQVCPLLQVPQLIV